MANFLGAPPPPGATPLSDEEKDGLIPDHIATLEELNAWEAANILEAEKWAFRRNHSNLLTDTFVRRLHTRMFDQTWTWAGRYRTSDKSVGVYWPQIPVRVRESLANTAEMEASGTISTDEIAARLHHQLVMVHPFPNGNGRHARLFTDLYLTQKDRPRFSWGGGDLQRASEIRDTYISALRQADQGNFSPLLEFVRSQ